MVGTLCVVCLEVVKVDPPAGSLSPLAWTIILALCGFIMMLLRALAVVYKDLKAANNKLNQRDEEALGLFRVMRGQMERSKGGPQ
jgi:TRAP-type C4-dicarboxylate transport system permease small subunit